MSVGMIEEDFERICIKHNIRIQIMDNLGSKVRGFCYYDGDMYHVILNNRFDELQLKRTVIHEVIHVLEEHFNCPVDTADLCEEQVSAIISQLNYATA